MPAKHEEITERELVQILSKYETGEPADCLHRHDVAPDVSKLVLEVRWLRQQCIDALEKLSKEIMTRAKLLERLQTKIKEANSVQCKIRPGAVVSRGGGSQGNPVPRPHAGGRPGGQPGARPPDARPDGGPRA